MATSSLCFLLLVIFGISQLADSTYYSRDYYRGRCEYQGCPVNYACERRRYSLLSRHRTCVPDIRDVIQSRLAAWDRFWNSRDFNGLESAYIRDALVLVPGLPLKRGRAGVGGVLSNLIRDNNLGNAKWTLDSFTPLGGDEFASVDLFEIKSAVGGAPLLGKTLHVWTKVNNVYRVKYQAINYNA